MKRVMHPGDEKRKPACGVFTELHQTVRMKLPKGHVFVMLSRGTTPFFGPKLKPGTYNVNISALVVGKPIDALALPLLVIPVPEARSFAFAALTAAQVNAMVGAAEVAFRAHAGGAVQ